MARKSCKQGYYYCYASKKCKKIPMGYVVGMGGWLRKEKEEESSDETEGKKTNGNGNSSNGNGNGNGGSNGGSNGGGVSEAWSAKYKKSIDCDNPKGFSQRAHCRGRKMNEQSNVIVGTPKPGGAERWSKMSSQEKAEYTAQKALNQVRGVAARYDDAKKAAKNVKITSGSVNIREKTCPVCGFDPCQCLEGVITEKRDGKSSKDKGYSLRDWFKGGGWKQTGGKYDGKPCAKQPGQKTKPYCRDADDRAAMSEEERNKRARKKRKEDSNPNREGRAKNVTQESYSNWRSDLEQLDEFMGLFGPKTVTPKDSPSGTKSVQVGKKYPARQNGRPVDVTYDNKGNKTVTNMSRAKAGMMQYKHGSTWGMPQYNSYEPEGKVVEGYADDGDVIRPTDRIKMKDGKLRTLKDIDAKLDKKTKKEEVELVDEGKKDACYHKVKSRYSIWPSAYASGALVKCRKVGAKNWGNKTKKEGYEFSNWRDDFQPTEYESVDIIETEPLQPTKGIGSDMLEEGKKCWKGYKKVGTQKLFGKTYNRCVKAHFSDWRAEMDLQEKKSKPDYLDFDGDGNKKEPMKKALKDKEDVKEDWQKSNRKDGVDGMSQKSVNAYKRENPGSKLQTAVTGKNPKGKDKKRRKSFCARSKGQKDMHNIDCSKTPDKKICKARKRWRCR